MCAHQCRHVAVEVVGRAAHLIGLGHGGDLHRLENAVPGQVNDADVHRIALEKVLELAAAEEGFTAREWRGNRAADQRERFRIEAVYLDPHAAMLSLLDRANEADVTLGFCTRITRLDFARQQRGQLATLRAELVGWGPNSSF